MMTGRSETLDLLEAGDVERHVVLSHVPPAARAAMATLWRLDLALAAVVRASAPAMVRQIKLVWWRDALAALDAAPAPPEPLLRALCAELLPRTVRGAELAALAEAWGVMLDEDDLDRERLRAFGARGALLFDFGARVLGAAADERIARAGAGWALVDFARHSGRRGEAEAALALAGETLLEPRPWPKQSRPLGMLAALAARDAGAGRLPLERQGAPARLLHMLRVRLLGR